MDLQAAAGSLGVHYQTAYAWVRQGVLPARKVGRGYEITEADVRAFADRRSAGAAPPRAIEVRDWPAQADGLYRAIVAGEETRARHRFERLAPGVPLITLCEHVLAPALRRVGDDWQAGLVSIAQEHRASAICERLIAARFGQPAGRPRGVAVVTTPPGERHGLPALMAAACLREERWLVHHLAADLPAPEVVALASGIGAQLVVLSAATRESASLAAGIARDMSAELPRVRVLPGHPGARLSDLIARSAGVRPADRENV